MRKTKIAFVLSLMLFSMFIFLSSASAYVAMSSANITINTPASSSVIAGNGYRLNATLDSTLLAENWTHATFYAKSASTANSSWTLVGSAFNDSNTQFTTTFNTPILQDSNDYIFNVTLNNGTAKIGKTNTGVTIDNTAPTAPTLSPTDKTQITSTTAQTFTGTVVDAKTTGCTYIIGRGGLNTASQDTTSGTATYSTTSCTFSKTFTDSGDNGIWYWQITASDGTNSSSSTNELQVNIPPTGGADITLIKKLSGENAKGMWIVLGIILLIVIFFVIKKR